MVARRLPAFTIAGVVLGLFLSHPVLARERVPLDAGWRFHPGEAPGASRPGFDDRGWRRVDLPHDWSIEGETAGEERVTVASRRTGCAGRDTRAWPSAGLPSPR